MNNKNLIINYYEIILINDEKRHFNNKLNNNSFISP